MATVLAISDIHIPAEHPKALAHCIEVYNRLGCTEVVFLGDIFDLHRASFHEHDSAMPSLEDEIKLCREKIKAWVKAFPVAKICESNHDSRIFRVANKVGIPSHCIKDIKEIFGLPKEWTFADSFIIDDVRYSHGMDCKGGSSGAYQSVLKHRRSQVYGHWHSFAGITWTATEHDLLYGFNCGCLIDNDHLAMRYGKHFVNKPVLGVGVIYNGNQPVFMPLDLGSKVEYKEKETSKVDDTPKPKLKKVRDKKRYTFFNKETNKLVKCTMYDLYTNYKLSSGNVSELIKGKRSVVNGWILVK